jgi:hypothetical protein
MTYTLLEAYSETVPIRSTDLRDEAERIWRDDDIAGRDMLAGRIQLFGPDGCALATTADYLWCPEVGRLGIGTVGDTDYTTVWLDADSLDEGIQTSARILLTASGTPPYGPGRTSAKATGREGER